MINLFPCSLYFEDFAVHQPYITDHPAEIPLSLLRSSFGMTSGLALARNDNAGKSLKSDS